MHEELKAAIEGGRTDIVRSVLSTLQESKENEAVLNQLLKETSSDGETLLHMATRLGQRDIVRTLLSAGADPSVLNSDGLTAFELAEPTQIIQVYREMLLQAIAQSNIQYVQLMLNAGMSVNFVDTAETNNTPLHWAASYANAATIDCLCAHGSDVNVANTAGHMPLHDAVQAGNAEGVSILVKYGADVMWPINQGKDAGCTALDLAGDNKEILAILNNTQNTDTGQQQYSEKADGDTEKKPKSPFLGPKLQISNGVAVNQNCEVDSSMINGPTVPHLSSPIFKPYEEVMKPPRPVITEEKLSFLWPQPQSILQKEGKWFHPQTHLSVYIASGTAMNVQDVLQPWEVKIPLFKAVGIELDLDILTNQTDLDQTHIMCHVNRRLCPGPGAYKITIMHKQLKIVCNDCDSLHYAISTLVQLFRGYLHEGKIFIPQLLIDDWPELPYRGVLLDISVGRIPNMDTIKELISILSGLKINQIHIYKRFKALEHPEWQVCYTKQQLRMIDAYCKSHAIQMIPVLDVTPAVQFEDIESLYSTFEEYLSCFNYNEFVSIGPRLSSFMLDMSDDNGINMNDMFQLLPIQRNQTLLLCGYPLHDLDRKFLYQLPPNLVFNEYGVQANHDFSKFCRPLSKHGVNFFVCPGTAVWNSIGGCPEAAVTNIYTAVKCATTDGGLGVVVSNWSGKSHLNHQPFCWPGFLVGAGLGWNSDCHWEYLLGNLGELMNKHIFQDKRSVVGHVVVELGRAETYLLRCARLQSGDDCSQLPADQGSMLYQFLINPDSSDLENLTPEILQKSIRHMKKCQTELKDSDMKCVQHKEIQAELNFTCDLMMLSAKIGRLLAISGRNPGGQAGLNVVNLGIANLPATMKTDVANKLLELLNVYQLLWGQRYLKHQDLQSSVGLLHGLLKQLIPGEDPKSLSETHANLT
ncbi:hypothetical protein ACJMK2_037101 [Sinanodonta woodiana]|uniref:Beta-hexosaminidase bacterial type N-terminal domain-containing protein n=1 Tax=Sinanodonta woodiana TaxID=1069815 RepID=A0ABD3WJK9_SINWO